MHFITFPPSSALLLAGNKKETPPVKVEEATTVRIEKAPKRPQRQKRGKSKAFDAVLEKEDLEGPVVVTSAAETGKPSMMTHL